jgi:hypothetical protein
MQGIGSFSVPLEEITAVRDRYPWMILTPDTIRLCLARDPEEVLMIFPRAFRQIAESSGGRVRLEGAADPAARATASGAGGR